MSKYNKTLWMGNIEPWMNQQFLISVLNTVGIYPKKTIIKNPANKRGCAFLEFNTHDEVEMILQNFNGKTFHNIEFKFNWVRTFKEKYSTPKVIKFTVNQTFI